MNVEIDPVFGCALYTGRLDKDGYGMTPSGKRAHTVAWEREHGAVPSGMVLEHRCCHRRCCLVRHLELVTQSENLYRRRFGRRLKEKACPFGHSMAMPVVTTRGGVLCRTCQQEVMGCAT